jgi:hypothetical protein
VSQLASLRPASRDALPHSDKDIRARLARIGVGPGKTFDVKDLSPEHQAAVLEGMKAGDKKVADFLASGMKNINGWSVGSFFGDAAFYKGDWLMRAGAAKGGIYGNDAVELVLVPALASPRIPSIHL